MKCSILNILQGSEHALISEYTIVMNKAGFWICQGYRSFYKILTIDVWQYSEYAWVSNMLGLHMALDKCLHHRYPISQGSLENDLSYMFDRVLNIAQVLSMVRLEYTRVVNIPRLHRILCKLHFKNFTVLGMY